MIRRVRVPIRVRPTVVSEPETSTDGSVVAEAVPPVADRRAGPSVEYLAGRSRRGYGSASRQSPATVARQPEPAPAVPEPEAEATPVLVEETAREQGLKEEKEEESAEVWRDRALRLQAEIENFRKRQQRLADERIVADRQRLLGSFLRVADDLQRALDADAADVDSLRQGVDLTYQTLMHVLDQEGAEPIEAEGQPFDPTWHEAVSTVPHQHAGAEPDTVVKVVQAGYRLGDRLLRPARVIVAV
jgi:molecular chaperone GrpE